MWKTRGATGIGNVNGGYWIQGADLGVYMRNGLMPWLKSNEFQKVKNDNSLAPAVAGQPINDAQIRPTSIGSGLASS